jgi:N6-adenosine-specific RNA methylase IME4
MKGVRCSWVDMQKIRQALSGGERGDATRLAHMRCLDDSTVRHHRAVCHVMDIMDERNVAYATFQSAQPSHAREISRAFRRKEKNWSDETKAEIVEWVERCEAEELTVEQLRAALRCQGNGKHCESRASKLGVPIEESLAKLVDDGEVFGTVYADPPWDYGNQRTRAATSNHYGTMTLEAIAALPVAQVAAEECHLHLWTTESFLEDGISILKNWGFERKSGFVWVKPQLGIGTYWRVSHEFMLLGVKGGLTFPPTNIKSWIEHERTEHSAKPESVRKLIEQVSPGPRLEMFGRRCIDGWTVIGDGIERGMYDGDVKEL